MASVISVIATANGKETDGSPAVFSFNRSGEGAAAHDILRKLLPEWHLLLKKWAASGRLTAAAQDALLLNGQPNALTELTNQWTAGEFSALPPIVLLSSAEINGALGAYAVSTGSIYLNADWLLSASQEQVIAVLTEELGHYLDGVLNEVDTSGDEGELFAIILINGMHNTTENIDTFSDDDYGLINIQATSVVVEKSLLAGSENNKQANTYSSLIPGIQAYYPNHSKMIDAVWKPNSIGIEGSQGGLNYGWPGWDYQIGGLHLQPFSIFGSGKGDLVKVTANGKGYFDQPLTPAIEIWDLSSGIIVAQNSNAAGATSINVEFNPISSDHLYGGFLWSTTQVSGKIETRQEVLSSPLNIATNQNSLTDGAGLSVKVDAKYGGQEFFGKWDDQGRGVAWYQPGSPPKYLDSYIVNLNSFAAGSQVNLAAILRSTSTRVAPAISIRQLGSASGWYDSPKSDPTTHSASEYTLARQGESYLIEVMSDEPAFYGLDIYTGTYEQIRNAHLFGSIDTGDTFISPSPTYILTPSLATINEGAVLTSTVTTTNAASGTTLYYSLSGTGVTTLDFSSGSLTGSGLVTSNGLFSFSHTLANDLTTEGTETLNIKLFSDSSLLTQVGSTASVSIADTSVTPVIRNTGTAAFSISGKGDVGSQVSIIKTKDDPEGNGKFTYKWQSSVDGTNWTNLAATSSSYTLAATDASKQLRASISYPDGKSFMESVNTNSLLINNVSNGRPPVTAGDFATPVNINLSLPAYIMSTNWNIDKYYYYVEQYPMTLRTAFYADYLAGRFTNQALYGQNHYLTGGQAEGRAMVDTSGILPDSNDYGAYVENYGITLLDIYRVDSRAVVNGGTMSLFAWGKEHYTNWGKAEGREISGGVEWGGIVRNNLDLYNQWQDAKIANPTLSAFAFGYQRQNIIKSTLGVLVGSDTADKLTGQIAYGLNGNDVICSDGGRGILAGGFGDDLLVAANGGSDLAYGGPGSDIFQLNAGSSFNIRDFRKGADMIQLGSTLTSSGVTMQWDSADNSTLFYNGSSVIGKVYGKRPTEFTYSDSTNGVSKVYI